MTAAVRAAAPAEAAIAAAASTATAARTTEGRRYEMLPSPRLTATSFGLQLSAWKGIALSGPLVELMDTSAFLKCGLGPGTNWR